MLTNDQRGEGRHIIVTRGTRDRREFAVFGRFGRPCLAQEDFLRRPGPPGINQTGRVDTDAVLEQAIRFSPGDPYTARS